MRKTALSTMALLLASATAAQAQSGPTPVPDAGGPSAVPPSEQPASEATAPAAVGEPQTGIADIVVTAQRRSERVQDVPIAISAFSSEQLQAQGVTNTLQLGNFVPNLVAQNNTGLGGANAYFLRGLGSTETIATFDPPVGTYVDDIYLSRQNANNLSMFDVERVEVLRGPQGTLFGRNTTGGAINVIMKTPARDFGGYAEAGIGSYRKKMLRGSVDLPATADLRFKLSGYWQDDRGYARNTTTGEWSNDDDGWGVRAAALARFGPGMEWNVSAMHVRNAGENILNFDCDPRNPSNCDGRFLTTGYTEVDSNTRFAFAGPNNQVQGRKAAYGQGQEARSTILSSKFDFDLAPEAQLSLISGYVDLAQEFGLDFFDGRGGPSLAGPVPAVVGRPTGGFVILNDGLHRQFSQEIKLNGRVAERLNYVTGIYYLNERNRTDLADVFAGALLLGDRIVRNKTKALAGYAQGDFEVIDGLTLTAGIRYTNELKTLGLQDLRPSCNDGTIEVTCLFNQNLLAQNGRKIPERQRTKIWTPRFAVNYKPSEDLLLFASATRGFKSGGWNARETSPARFFPFGPETVWSYEAGLKSDLLGRRLRANLTLFQLDVTDLQVLAGFLNTTTGAINFITRNFADYRNRGLEAEFTLQPSRGINLYANIGYMKDKYIVPRNVPDFDEFGVKSVNRQQADCRAALATGRIPGGTGAAAVPDCASGIVGANGNINTPVRTPDWTLATGASYRIGLGGSGWSLTPSVNASYRSRVETVISNLSFFSNPVSGSNGSFPSNPFGNGSFITGSRSPAAWLVNANLMLSGPNDRITITAECNNCLDKEIVQSGLSNFSYLNFPQTWMIRTRVGF